MKDGLWFVPLTMAIFWFLTYLAQITVRGTWSPYVDFVSPRIRGTIVGLMGSTGLYLLLSTPTSGLSLSTQLAHLSVTLLSLGMILVGALIFFFGASGRKNRKH